MSKKAEAKGSNKKKKARSAAQKAATARMLAANAARKSGPKKSGRGKSGRGTAGKSYVTEHAFRVFKNDVAMALDEHKRVINDHGDRIDNLSTRMGNVEDFAAALIGARSGPKPRAPTQQLPASTRTPTQQMPARPATHDTIVTGMPKFN